MRLATLRLHASALRSSQKSLLLSACVLLSPCFAQSPAIIPSGILQQVTNAQVIAQGDDLLLTRTDRAQPIRLNLTGAQTFGLSHDNGQWFVLPLNTPGAHITANSALWLLPSSNTSRQPSWHIELDNIAATAEQQPQAAQLQISQAQAGPTQAEQQTILLFANRVVLRRAEPRPHCDLFGHHFRFALGDNHVLEDTLATFYWGTMLPSVVERTLAAHFPYSSGYVLSTLETSRYAGSYPAVDHEFQIRGRLAFASPFDLDLVERMLNLQLQLQAADPEHLSRAPTSVQPDGRREYHIRRDSEDHRENAGMFPVTGNIEILEEAWLFFEATSNRSWLAAHIAGLEQSAHWVLSNTDQYGRVWSDVFYEDQVIKDGRVTQAQAFAAHAFEQLAQMETILGRTTQASQYRATARSMASTLIAPLPLGFWNNSTNRFVDWVDRNGNIHDHIHLLANTLPVTLGFATPQQRLAIQHLVAQNDSEFERFPSFLSAHIDAYTPSEIGIAGPYDLSAAGRYWYWDAAYRAQQNQNALLLHQLSAVAAEAAQNDGFMDERYDMDHVFYIDGKHAHGAGKYYEYPNVFAAVLLRQYLGLSLAAGNVLQVHPHLAAFGSISLEIPAYAIAYRWDKTGFFLTNLASAPRHIKVDLSSLPGPALHLRHGAAIPVAGPSPSSSITLTLPPHGQAHWIPASPVPVR